MKNHLILIFSLVTVFGYAQTLVDPTLSPTTARINAALSDAVAASGTDTYTGTKSGLTNVTDRAYSVKFTNANTGSATFNLNASGAVTIRKFEGGSLVNLVAGDIAAGETKRLRYNGTYLVIEGGAGGGGISELEVGVTDVTSGTNTRVLYDNAGTLGEYAISGTGSVAMTNSPTFVTPALGTPSSGVGTNITGIVGTNVTNTPAGGIAATTVQAAINELDTEKVAVSDIGLTTNLSNVNILSTSSKGLQLGANGNVYQSIDATGNYVFTTSDTDTGSPTAFTFSPGVRTNNTASTSAPDFIFDSYRPVQYSTGNFNNDLTSVFYPKVISAIGPSTIKTAATVTIVGGAVADNNITITNNPSLYSMADYGEFEASGSSAADRNIVSSRYSSDNGSPRFIFKKSRGSRYSPSAVTTGDFVGGITTASYDGTAYYYLNPIAFVVNGTVSTSSVPVDIIFQGNGIVEQARMMTNGKWGFKVNNPVSTIDIVGSVGYAIATVTTNTTLTDANHTTLVDATSGNLTITLPTSASAVRRVYTIKKIDASANTVTIDGNGAESIDGSPTYVITAQNDFIGIQSVGNSWVIISK